MHPHHLRCRDHHHGRGKSETRKQRAEGRTSATQSKSGSRRGELPHKRQKKKNNARRCRRPKSGDGVTTSSFTLSLPPPPSPAGSDDKRARRDDNTGPVRRPCETKEHETAATRHGDGRARLHTRCMPRAPLLPPDQGDPQSGLRRPSPSFSRGSPALISPPNDRRIKRERQRRFYCETLSGPRLASVLARKCCMQLLRCPCFRFRSPKSCTGEYAVLSIM